MPLDRILSHWQPVRVLTTLLLLGPSTHFPLDFLKKVVKWAKDYAVHPLSTRQGTTARQVLTHIRPWQQDASLKVSLVAYVYNKS